MGGAGAADPVAAGRAEAAAGRGEAAAGRAQAAELLVAISAVRRSARRAVRHAWASEPLPPARGELLRLVASRPGIGVAEAAQELHLAPNTVSTLVGKLTDQGLLSRARSLPDGRSVRLEVTDKGQARIEEFRDLRAELAGRALAELPDSDRAALTSAIPALVRLAEKMEAP
jgi:DNA-binding MarR family transcriptional regulator